MSLVVEGHGFSVAHGALSITQSPITVELPGWTREELERTTQNNSSWKTKDLGDLKELEDFSHQFPYDPADYATWQGAADSDVAHVITFPNGTSTYTVYGKIKSVGNISQETDGRPVYDVTFTPTNVDGSGTETGPSYSA
jgi:hypothetical protein